MAQELYRIGGQSSTGDEIASILGQGPRGCVFTTTTNQLRWVYWHNKGVTSEQLQSNIDYFDVLMSRIKRLSLQVDEKRGLYELLGKSLFSAIAAPKPKSPDQTFAVLEAHISNAETKPLAARARRASRKVFIVHGHDEGARESVARFLERLELEPVILQDIVEKGRTVIEKFEDESDVGFAVVLLTPDDIGGSSKFPKKLHPRARQNVVFELGYFAGTLGRGRVTALTKGEVEVPSDYQGVLFLPLDATGGWKLRLAQELQAAGLLVDLNKVSR